MQSFISLACLFTLLLSARCIHSDTRVVCYVDASTDCVLHGNDLCTHAIHSSAYIDDDYTIKPSADVTAGHHHLQRLAERNPTIKILLGVEAQKSRFEAVASNETSLGKLVDSAVRHVRDGGFDGLDLTWLENPVNDRHATGSELHTNLLKVLRGGLDKEAVNSSKNFLLLSTTVSIQSDQNKMDYNARTFPQYVDFISLMPAQVGVEGEDIDSTVNYWRSQRVDSEKLTLVVPTFVRLFGRRWRGHRRRTHELISDQSEGHSHHSGSIITEKACQDLSNGKEDFDPLMSVFSESRLKEDASVLRQKGMLGIGVVYLDIDSLTESECGNNNVRAVLESKVMMPTCPRHHYHHRHHGHHGPNHRGHHKHHGFGDRSHHSPHSHYHHADGHHGHSQRGHHHHGHPGHRHHRHHHIPTALSS